MKLKINFEDDTQYIIEDINSEISLNNSMIDYSISRINSSELLILKDQKVYNIRDIEKIGNEWRLKINGQPLTIGVKDHLAQILEDLGMNAQQEETISDLHAPMPGAIIDINISEGESVVAGQTLLILEAMKMENIIKCPIDGTISKIHISKGQKVEKNQVLVSF